jgi:hypothetical protein
MYDTVRDRESLPARLQEQDHGAFSRVRQTLVEAGADPKSALDLELAAVAAWCAGHGLAEMASFRQFDQLKEACGGEIPFLVAIFRHMNLVLSRRPD